MMLRLQLRQLPMAEGLCMRLANCSALSFHPDIEAMKSVNAAKGRPLDQVASVATTGTHISGLFDWDSLPEGFTRGQVMRMINRFYDKGPFGFRGPAAQYIPSHLTTAVAGVLGQFKLSPLGITAPRISFLRQHLKGVERNISG